MTLQILFEIRETLISNKDSVMKILSEIENYDEAAFELDISIRALSSPQKYFTNCDASLSVFLPMNLPLYSLILYAIIPRLCCNKVYYKPATLTLKISKALHEVLNLDRYGIYLVDANRNFFLENYAKQSEVVIFTGKPINAGIIKEQLAPSTLFLFFGAAQNPIIVESDANLNKACNIIYESIIFNYGQDCAKPNCVLLNSLIADKFVKKVIKKIEKEGSHRKTSIKDSRELFKVGRLLVENNSSIIYGGGIDCNQSTMEPVVLCSPIRKDDKYIYEEFYAPVFKFLTYNSDEDLRFYFENDKYKKQAMTVTLFGHNDYVENIKNSIILYEETISHIDNGNIEFGGFGCDVSHLQYQGLDVVKPILVNREISYFLNNTAILKNINIKYKSRRRKRELVIQMVKDKIIEVFGENLVVAFVFGAYAKFEESLTSDIDIFIGIKNNNEEQKDIFRKWYFEVHYMFGLIPDVYFPAEIITIEELEDMLDLADTTVLRLYNDLNTYNTVFYTQILLDKKIFLFGTEGSLNLEKYDLQEIAINWCKQTAKVLMNLRPDLYNKYANKFYFFQPQKDLLTISHMLNYQIPYNEKYVYIVEKMDDGLFLKLMHLSPEIFSVNEKEDSVY